MIPASFIKDGFKDPSTLRPKLRRLLIGSEGPADSGKTEFALSAPGPGMCIVMDRGIDPVFDNPNPPASRGKDWGFQVITAPLQTQATQQVWQTYWGGFRDTCKTACANVDCRTIVIDGDSDSWELQRLAAFGKLDKVPSILYTEVNAARRAFYARFWDAGKIIIATNKTKKLYENVYLPDGTLKLGNDGKPIREWKGKYERQGFDDQEYLWQIQLRHYYNLAEARWGIEIIKCKAVKELEGMTLEGDECNFKGLVSAVYPDVPLSEWGFR